MAQITNLPGAAFLAFPDMRRLLTDELSARFSTDATSGTWYGDILHIPAFEQQRVPYWARTALLTPFIMRFDSIGDAARTLSSIQRNWASYQFGCWRRAQLIQEKLPFIPDKPRAFPTKVPATPMGIFTLLDANTAICSASTNTPVPLGKLEFEEDHKNPPSRAYLKLREALTWANVLLDAPYPKPGDRCLDAGACPGGWTWVLRGFGADVHAIDRSPLAPQLMHDPHVTFQAHDAFTIPPRELGAFDWVVSDVICYPERLLPWVCDWLDSSLAKNMVCTIKLQGGINWDTIAQFDAIPNSRVVHLNYNKHELTFISHR